MTINGTDIEEYGAYLLGTPKISPAPLSTDVLTFKSGANFIPLGRTIGLKKIECSIAFLGDSYHDIQLKRSRFRAALLGKLNIDFETDGFQYFCTYNTDAELESERENAAVSVFTFTGVQHESLETVKGKDVNCLSTVPETDCRITATGSNVITPVIIAGVRFDGMVTGDIFVIDGIDKRIQKNGKDYPAEFIKFPTLKPGTNTIESTKELVDFTIEYYPTHM